MGDGKRLPVGLTRCGLRGFGSVVWWDRAEYRVTRRDRKALQGSLRVGPVGPNDLRAVSGSIVGCTRAPSRWRRPFKS